MQRLLWKELIRNWKSLRLGPTFISELNYFLWLNFVTNFFTNREILENTDPRFNENGTLSFVPKRHSIPLPDRSIGDPNKDIIITANLPLLGLSTAAAKMSVFTALAASTLAKSTSARAILNLTVHDYLWGYEDNLVRLANTIVPNYINFDRFGLLDRVSWLLTI